MRGLVKKNHFFRMGSVFQSRLSYLYPVIIALLSIAGAWIVSYSTSLGPWGGSDSYEYLVSTRSMLRGIGIGYYSVTGVFHWISLHPPFYPIVLGTISLFGIDLVNAARWLDIILFALTIGTTGIILFHFCNSTFYSILACLLVLAFSPMLKIYTSVMSEPLFFFLCVLHVLFLLIYLRTPQIKWLLVSALTAGLAALTRYIGISLIGAAVVSLLMFSKGTGSGRIKKSVMFLAVASLPLLLWSGWLYFGPEHSLAGRSASLELSGLLRRLQPFRLAVVDTIWGWLPFQDKISEARYRVRLAFLSLIVIGTSVITIIAYKRFLRDKFAKAVSNNLHVFGTFGLFSLAYLAFLAFSTAFSNLPPDINDRMLLPVYISVVVALFAAFSLWGKVWLTGFRQVFKIIPWFLVAACVLQYQSQSLSYISKQHNIKGMHYWEHTEIVAAVQALPLNIPIISTRPNILLLWADRPAYLIKMNFSSEFLSQTGPFGTDPHDPLQVLFQQQGAALVDFNDLSPQFLQKYGGEYVERLDLLIKGLVVYQQFPDGVIYFYPGR